MSEPMVETVDSHTFRRLFKEGWLTPLSAGKRWGVSEVTIWKWYKAGKLRVKVTVDGRHFIIDPKQARP